jgi:hypothetical protein
LHVAKYEVKPGAVDCVFAGDAAFDKDLVGSAADRAISFDFPHGTSPPLGHHGKLEWLNTRLCAFMNNAAY